MLKNLLYYAIFLVTCSNPVAADWVTVSTSPANQGIGYVFATEGGCRVLVPGHVHKESQKVAIKTIQGDEYWLRLLKDAPGDDISLFEFLGKSPVCSRKWQHVLNNGYQHIIDKARQGEATAIMITIINGDLATPRVTIDRRDANSFTLSVPDWVSKSANKQGLSGSGVYIQAENSRRLVGIVTDWIEKDNVYLALRTEQIPQVLGMEVVILDQGNNQSPNVDGPGSGIRGDIVPRADSAGELFPGDVTPCDILASNPQDPEKHTSSFGVEFADIDIDSALIACKEDSGKVDGKSARLLYQLGRAQHAALTRDSKDDAAVNQLQFARTLAPLSAALKKGHDNAIFNIAEILVERPELCPNTDQCYASYLSSLNDLEEHNPADAKFRRAYFIAFKKVDEKFCAPHKNCDDAAAALFEELRGTSYEATGLAHLAYLVRRNRVGHACATDSSCLTFMLGAFEEGAKSGLNWANRELGDLLLDELHSSEFCSDADACRDEGLLSLRTAADHGDRQAMENLGDFFSESGNHELLNCEEIYGHNCSLEALKHYERALEEGGTQVKRDVAWLYFYRQEELGCSEDGSECASKAAGLLEDPSLKDDWSLSLKAYGMDRYPAEFAQLCGDVGCPQASLSANLEAAKTRAYNQERSAWALFYLVTDSSPDEVLDCGVGLTNEASCYELAIDLSKQALNSGRSSALEPYSDLVGAFDYGEGSAATAYLRQIGCDVPLDTCIAFLDEWLSAFEAEFETKGFVADRHSMQLISDMAFLPSEDFDSSGINRAVLQSLHDLQARALHLLHQNIVAISQRETPDLEFLDDQWSFVFAFCNQKRCHDLVMDIFASLPPKARTPLLSNIAKARITMGCSSPSSFCDFISDDELMQEMAKWELEPFFGNFYNGGFGQGRLADFIEKKLISEGIWGFAAERAKARIWDAKGVPLWSQYDREDFEQVLRPIVQQIRSEPLSTISSGIVDAAIVALEGGKFRGVNERTKGELYLALYSLEKARGEKSVIEFWKSTEESSVLPNVVRNIQQALGFKDSNLDGVWGKQTEAGLARYVSKCGDDKDCTSARIRDAATSVLEGLDR